jgi:hypothetical protein
MNKKERIVTKMQQQMSEAEAWYVFIGGRVVNLVQEQE